MRGSLTKSVDIIHNSHSMDTVVDTRLAGRALSLVGVVFGLLAVGTLVAILAGAHAGGDHLHVGDLSTAKRVEYLLLVALVVGFCGLVSWHVVTSDAVQLGASTIKSAAMTGRLFFFTSYWFKLEAPESKGKPFRLSYSISDATGEKPLDIILLEPGTFTVNDIKHERPTHPKHRCFRIDGAHVHTGQVFKCA